MRLFTFGHQTRTRKFIAGVFHFPGGPRAPLPFKARMCQHWQYPTGGHMTTYRCQCGAFFTFTLAPSLVRALQARR